MILDSISVGEILGSWPYDIPRIEMSWTIIQPDFNFRSGETECQFCPKKYAQIQGNLKILAYNLKMPGNHNNFN